MVTDAASPTRQPRALYVLFMTELWERFSFYGMQALLMLYMTKHLGFEQAHASSLNGWYGGLVYLTPLGGGLLADRLLGYKRTIILGGTLMMIGHFLMAIDRLPVFYTALACLIIGVGGIKANISTVVGKLYQPGDARRDRGFTIFYMGINIGGLLAPLVCGYLGESVSWHLGFAAAGVGMAIGLASFLYGQRLLAGVDLGPASRGEKESGRKAIAREDWGRIAVLLIIWVFVMLFWAGYFQTWVTLTLWADANTYRPMLPSWLGGKVMPASWTTSFNSAYIIVLTPLVNALWLALARRGLEPSSPFKMVLGLVGLALSFAIMVMAARLTGGHGASLAWLGGCYFLMTVGELTLSPVGLSLVTKLAPPGIGGALMGIWFLTNAVGYKLGGWVGEYWERVSHGTFFAGWVVVSLAAALVFLLLLPTLKRLAHGAE
ncbi:MAG TPA: peptide MFS transporter [Polyangia bacterium]|nr:peptide MFS transporter [Polyangia bacterium]